MVKHLTEEDIIQRLASAHVPGVIAATDGVAEAHVGQFRDDLICAAVLMPLARLAEQWHLVFTRRTDTVGNHKGQVSFPGGACDENETAEATALREAHEEIGIRSEDIHILGRLNDFITITSYVVTPVVCVIPWPYDFKLSLSEVKRVFTIPLTWLAHRENWREKKITNPKEPRQFPLVVYQAYQGEVLWGASARMTLEFLHVLGLIKNRV